MSSMATRRPRIETSFDIRKSSSSPLLEKLDHRDWLAPNEAMKIFKTLKNADQVLVALKKISSRNDYKPNESLFSLIVDRLARERRIDDIEDVLQTVKYTKIKVSDSFFSNLIKIYINVANHPEKAIQVLFRMSEFHCCPTIDTFNLVLNMLLFAANITRSSMRCI
ncbi:hypothetical protein ZOSMA_76G00310 [Zostera marina]|uniref:Pentatricopeptide repeat-containing protein n=1 Tax=Zostera marina TaxID=29655 RepID=A0A0K9NR63_ZOSMR|nr:hypothetical protein ZOSMA_76G00310 [Zostera marina]